MAETCDTATARGDARFAEGIVSLIVYYVVFMIVGDFAAYFLGLFTEYEWGSQVSLIVFLALYFLFLWVSWVLAVRVTSPNLRSSSHLDEARPADCLQSPTGRVMNHDF